MRTDTQPLRILLVEDSDDFKALVEAMLAGEAVHHAGTVASAISRLRAEAFDIVLLDLQLPDATGFEALESLRAESPDCPIIVVTASVSEVTASEMLARGAQESLMKSAITKDVLVRAVRTALERQEAREERIRSGDLVRNILDAGHVVVLQLDLAGRVQLFNRAGEALTGYSQEELLGKSWFDVLVPSGRYPDVRARFREIERTGLPRTLINPILTKGGQERTISWSNSEVREKGRLAGTLSFGIDITEQLRTEAALAASEERLRQSQKLEAIGRLAGGIAHDFNNLLMIIRGYADLIVRNAAGCEPHRGKIDEISRAADRAADLTRQLLAFSRKQVLQPRVIDVRASVQEIEGMLRRLIGEHIELVTALAEDAGTVRADPAQVSQVIINLAANARDAMPGGGRLTIGVANLDLDEFGAHQHSPATPGHFVVLSVADTGGGMDRETRERIFEPFFTTKEQGKGTGLGLATVYGIVKQSGGFIWVYSEVDRGTTFKIFLPRVDAAADARNEPPPVTHLEGKERILVAEDEEPLRNVICELLESLGYTAIAAADPAHALRISGERGIDLLLTDVVMPGMTGRDLAAKIIAQRPGVKVLYMSGYAADSLSTAAGDASDHWVDKPFTAEMLAMRVRELLDR